MCSAIWIAVMCWTFASGAAMAQLVFEDLTGALTAQDLADLLAGDGVTVQSATFTGAETAAGTFTGGSGIVGFESGVILSSGPIQNAIGPNVCPDAGNSGCVAKPAGNLSQLGDSDLQAQVGTTTFDAAILEFELIPSTDSLFLEFVFASDEYNEYVGSEFNDGFALFVNGVNCAQINGQPVAINNVNNGNPTNATPASNPAFFIDNDPHNPAGPVAGLDIEMDGLTVTLSCQATVDSGIVNLVKLVIADAVDAVYDSNVYLRAASVSTSSPPIFDDGFESGDTVFWSATVP